MKNAKLLRKAIIESYQERFPDDPDYVEENISGIEDRELVSLLIGLNLIDDDGMEIISEKIGWSIDELDVVRRFIVACVN